MVLTNKGETLQRDVGMLRTQLATLRVAQVAVTREMSELDGQLGFVRATLATALADLQAVHARLSHPRSQESTLPARCCNPHPLLAVNARARGALFRRDGEWRWRGQQRRWWQ